MKDKRTKNMSKIVLKIMILVVVAAFALPTTAQNWSSQPVIKQQTITPGTSFQSTSTMTGSGSSYTPNPTIGSNGTAYSPSSYAPSRIGKPRKADANDDGFDDETGLPVGNIDNPIVDPNDPGNTPIGDAALPLILLALAYAIYKVYRKKAA